MFASEHWGLEPDILVVGKGNTSGYVPLSASIVSTAIAETIWGVHGHQFLHGSTYAGHPVACAAALANLAIFERDAVIDHGSRMGERLLSGLKRLADRPLFGNVSGAGLLYSIELVTNKETKELAPAEAALDLVDRIAREGVLIRSMPNGIYFYPPLVITEDEVDRMVAATTAAFDDLD
jgi:adenosylmethionine-8-amino-7-oxononanoate aminotransferase